MGYKDAGKNGTGSRITAENAAIYAKRSAEVRRAKKCLRDIAHAALYEKPPLTKKQLQPIADYYNCKVEDITIAEAAVYRQVMEMLRGERGAFELVANYAGEKPAEHVEMTVSDFSALDEAFANMADDEE